MFTGTILVVDDEQAVRDLARLYLEREGFRVETAADGEEALARVADLRPDLIVLDIMLPKMDGWAVCREIRRELVTPIIFLSAKGEEYDRILGLELGADDYLTKPFSPRELVARVKAVLRRGSAGSGGKTLRYPGIVIDGAARTVEADGQNLVLAPREFELLWFLALHPGQVFSRDQLLTNVWGYSYPGDQRTVDTHVKRLREKMPDKSASYLKTVWGRGYKFEVTS
ncbi:MAG: response regulator transcription factor [Eubacteriales bacterium]|jgi:two-component system response regulator ResD|nr:response regulator transcription factor [Bacillota bacterium]MBV1727643.1 response regulator transcription factor [Desulforudis sp.]MDP3051175.1 response regulator transcription factor [Eubacteriales bacterium]MDQ7789213.1 response regulator transcription factor [Clostridia bacterium]MBU4532705.1 response regulator transcription factor [Bacillota bacterium]